MTLEEKLKQIDPQYVDAILYWQNNQGKKAVDKVTGFKGVITGYAFHLTGCNTTGLTPAVDKDGKIVNANYFDEARIVVIEGEGSVAINPEDVKGPKPGCMDNPTPTTHNP